jgi:hypothetical protein
VVLYTLSATNAKRNTLNVYGASVFAVNVLHSESLYLIIYRRAINVKRLAISSLSLQGEF